MLLGVAAAGGLVVKVKFYPLEAVKEINPKTCIHTMSWKGVALLKY